MWCEIIGWLKVVSGNCVNVFEEFVDFNFRWSDFCIRYRNRVSDLRVIKFVSWWVNNINYCL